MTCYKEIALKIIEYFNKYMVKNAIQLKSISRTLNTEYHVKLLPIRGDSNDWSERKETRLCYCDSLMGHV